MSTEEKPEEKQDDAHAKAEKAQERHEQAKETMKELEKDPPDKLEDWPDDAAKYETFGTGDDSEAAVYDEKHEEALGEHSVRHHDDGSVEVKGEKVDNPDDYKGEPIPGGPTDPNAPALPGEENEAKQDAEDSEKSHDSEKSED